MERKVSEQKKSMRARFHQSQAVRRCFTAMVYDKDGNVISSDTQEMTAKVGLLQKIVAFFKKIFGLTKTISEHSKVYYDYQSPRMASAVRGFVYPKHYLKFQFMKEAING